MTGDIWIDGFNLFHHWAPTRRHFSQGADVVIGQELSLRLLSHALGRRRRRVTIFLDGGLRREAGTRHGLRVRWSGPGRKADDLMIEGLYGRPGRTSSVVAVSNDRSLTAHLRALGAKIMRVSEFIERFLQRPENAALQPDVHQQKNQQLSRHEVDAWLEVFGASDKESDAGP